MLKFSRNGFTRNPGHEIWWTTRKEKPARFLETVILCEAFHGNFKRKLSSALWDHIILVHSCFLCLHLLNISVCLLSILSFLCNAIFSFSFKYSEEHLLLLVLLYAWCLSKISHVIFALRLLSFIFPNLLDSSVSDLRFVSMVEQFCVTCRS